MTRILPYLATLAAMAAVLALTLNRPAASHEWYPEHCCSGQDCAPIPDSAVSETADAITIRLLPGEHPMVDAPFTATIPRDDRRIGRSPDGGWHVCLYPDPEGGMRLPCIFEPGRVG